MTFSLGIIGATGKMGRALLLSSLQDPEVKIGGACASPRSPQIGKDLGQLLGIESWGVNLEEKPEDFVEAVDVLVDFSTAQSALKNVKVALEHETPLLIGTTGHSEETKLEFESAAQKIPLLFSPNFSLGIALCLEACSFFARHLKGSCFVDIVETHHTQKKDSPSGTALALGKSLGFGSLCPGTLTEQPRSHETVGIHSIRAGSVVGEHRIIFDCQGERIEIKHEALSREAFAKGAIRAAKFLSRVSPGLYTVKDLLHAF
jgi:4-hydroxy-tetrahydrodipicolinate reductase